MAEFYSLCKGALLAVIFGHVINGMGGRAVEFEDKRFCG